MNWSVWYRRLTGLVKNDSLALQQDKRFAMPWNETDRAKYAVIAERYATGLSDDEYALVAPLLPPAKPRGRKPADAREILNALFYLVRAGCSWRLLPKCFPPSRPCKPASTPGAAAAFGNNVCVLVFAVRGAEGKKAVPTVVIVDSQSVKTTEAGGQRGYDAGKKVKGRKRPLVVDTLGLPIKCQVTPADVQDRGALLGLLAAVSRQSPWVELPIVDGACSGDETARATFEASRIRVSVVKRTDREVKGFVLLPKRWIVERTLGWLNRARRLVKDYEALVESSSAWLMLALAVLLTRRLGH